jgi:hypothetical protein
MASNDRPVLFSGAMMAKAVHDDSFFEKFPQFRTIKAKLNAMHVNMKSNKGCSSCQKRRVQYNMERDFTSIMSSLDKAEGERFKNYFGVKKLVVHSVNPTTHAAYLKEIG